jgi:hypothetical protein
MYHPGAFTQLSLPTLRSIPGRLSTSNWFYKSLISSIIHWGISSSTLHLLTRRHTPTLTPIVKDVFSQRLVRQSEGGLTALSIIVMLTLVLTSLAASHYSYCYRWVRSVTTGHNPVTVVARLNARELWRAHHARPNGTYHWRLRGLAFAAWKLTPGHRRSP